MTLAGIIFDLDGTIIDTETPDYTAWRESYRQFGLELSMDLWKQRVGRVYYDGAPDVFDPLVYFEQITGKPMDGLSREAQYRRYIALCEAQPILPGVMDILNLARERNLKLGMASNSDRNWVEHWLKFLGLRHYFEHVFTRDDVKNAKPAPDMYTAVVQALGLTPDQCFALEDSPTGMEAALRSGLRCVGIPGTLTAHLPHPEVHLLLNKLSDLSAEELLSKFG